MLTNLMYFAYTFSAVLTPDAISPENSTFVAILCRWQQYT